jgi:hypothetical protein
MLIPTVRNSNHFSVEYGEQYLRGFGGFYRWLDLSAASAASVAPFPPRHRWIPEADSSGINEVCFEGWRIVILLTRRQWNCASKVSIFGKPIKGKKELSKTRMIVLNMYSIGDRQRISCQRHSQNNKANTNDQCPSHDERRKGA